MLVRIAAVAAILSLANAFSARAQDVQVESALRFTLRIEVADPVGIDPMAAHEVLRTVSFSNKDLRDLMSDLLNTQDVRSLVVRRVARAGDAALDSALLGRTIVFLDARGEPIDPVGAAVVLETRLDPGSLSPLLGRSAVALERDGTRIMARRERAIEAGELRISGLGNDLRFGLLGVSTAEARRRSDGARDLGLLFAKRSVELRGGADLQVESPSLSPALRGRGVVTGTIEASGERPVQR
jgi:hypothetical protein